jgi:hypothetical protein
VKRKWVLVIAGIVALQAAVLRWMGQPFICTCGAVRLWVSDVASRENSQQFTDWYTFTHILHGMLFYAALNKFARRLPWAARLTLAVLIESAWEITENTPFVIDRYRQSALANGYVGDSVLNSVSDTVAMMIGFLFAAWSPVWLAAGLGLAIEVVLALAIRDNLTLNIIQLLHPFEFISRWQAGG